MTQYKQIEGYENLYEISSEGEVISLRYNKRKTMKISLMSSGYKMVNLKKDKKQRSWSIHRLLALHFIPNPNNLPQVNHKDGNKLNNALDNLEWCTRNENIQHMYDKGLKTYKPLHNLGKFGSLHNRSKAVECSNGKMYGSMSEAARELNIHSSSVSWAVKNNKPIFGLQFKVKD